MVPEMNGLPSPRDPDLKPINLINRISKTRPVTVAGPMVRYLKLPFRETCRHFGTDIVYTPMILAREFVRNEIARLSDFTTNRNDQCVVVQVGVNNVNDLLRFCEMIHPYVDGVGINCGCPIRDQVREGIGAALMLEPELVADMVRAVKEKYGDSLCIETKIRIHWNLEETVRFAKGVEAAGVDYITVHGRTKNTRSLVPVNLEGIRVVKEAVSVPVIANGDCFTMTSFNDIVAATGVDGVMSARGVLANPALFAGYDECPWMAVEVFLDYAFAYGLNLLLVMHHFGQMVEKRLPKRMTKELYAIKMTVDFIDWVDRYFILKRRGDVGFAELVDLQWQPGMSPREFEEAVVAKAVAEEIQQSRGHFIQGLIRGWW